MFFKYRYMLMDMFFYQHLNIAKNPKYVDENCMIHKDCGFLMEYDIKTGKTIDWSQKQNTSRINKKVLKIKKDLEKYFEDSGKEMSDK